MAAAEVRFHEAEKFRDDRFVRSGAAFLLRGFRDEIAHGLQQPRGDVHACISLGREVAPRLREVCALRDLFLARDDGVEDRDPRGDDDPVGL